MPPVGVAHFTVPLVAVRQYRFASLEPTKTKEPSGDNAGDDCTFPPVIVDHRSAPAFEYDRMYLSSLPTYSDPSPPTLTED